MHSTSVQFHRPVDMHRTVLHSTLTLPYALPAVIGDALVLEGRRYVITAIYVGDTFKDKAPDTGYIHVTAVQVPYT